MKEQLFCPFKVHDWEIRDNVVRVFRKQTTLVISSLFFVVCFFFPHAEEQLGERATSRAGIKHWDGPRQNGMMMLSAGRQGCRDKKRRNAGDEQSSRSVRRLHASTREQ